jgi:protein gp37
MGDPSVMESTDATWNPVRVCPKVSPGCDGGIACARLVGRGSGRMQEVPGPTSESAGPHSDDSRGAVKTVHGFGQDQLLEFLATS